MSDIHKMRKITLISLMALAGCASPRLPNNQTANEQFYRLGYGEKRIAQNFYQLGEGDTVKRLYWAQRRVQETGYQANAGVSLQRRYVNVPVPEHIEPDGTIKEASVQAVEVVQFMDMVMSHGRKTFVVR